MADLRNAGHRERLRRRFAKSGLRAFSEHEVVELLLTMAVPRGDVKPTAKALLARFGDLRGVLDAPADLLSSVHGVGPVAATNLRVIREVCDLYLQRRCEGSPVLKQPRELRDFWRSRIGGRAYEVFEVGYLDSGLRLLPDGVEELERGTVDRAAVYPRVVVESALRRQAAGVVFAHNHPNGEVSPTAQDKTLTRALVLGTEAVQIKVVDHLIVSTEEVFSFRDEGLL